MQNKTIMATIVLGTHNHSTAAILVHGDIIERFESSVSCWKDEAHKEFIEWREAMEKKYGIATIQVINL